MATTRFSPFELLLLKSRNQTDTAALLLLAWVAASKGNLSDADSRQLSRISAGFRHGHDPQPIVDIASRQDLDAIQLAAEVLQKDCWGEPAAPFLRQAAAIATSDGKLASATNHVLRFLADLLGTSPQRFNQLFRETAGKDFETPEDPSQADYWHARERARQQQSHQREQTHSQRQEREQSHRQEQAHRADERPPPSDRTLRALSILGLEAHATRSDIKKAYRRLAQTHHPDRFFSMSEREVASASRRFQKIKNAYEYLMQDARSV